MKNIFLFLFIGLMTAPAIATEKPPVVVELFTSEVCGFCPPADKFLGSLAGQSGIIALACHVDYFRVDGSHLPKSFCTDRQKKYIAGMTDVRANYTPQMVVNGHMDAIGYEADQVSAAILKGRSEQIERIALSPKGTNSYSVILPDLKRPTQTDLVLISYKKPQTVTLTRGPNLGQQVTYTNVVQSLHNIGSWDGRAALREIDTRATAGIGGFVLLAQDTLTGRILAVGEIK